MIRWVFFVNNFRRFRIVTWIIIRMNHYQPTDFVGRENFSAGHHRYLPVRIRLRHQKFILSIYGPDRVTEISPVSVRRLETRLSYTRQIYRDRTVFTDIKRFPGSVDSAQNRLTVLPRVCPDSVSDVSVAAQAAPNGGGEPESTAP